MHKEKTKRVLKALSYEKPDRIPITEYFWDEFLEKWREEKHLSEDKDIYQYYDLDLKIISPNMDPQIESCQIIKQTKEHVIFKSGFGCTLKKNYSTPIPQFLDFSIHSAKEYERFFLKILIMKDVIIKKEKILSMEMVLPLNVVSLRMWKKIKINSVYSVVFVILVRFFGV